VALQRLEQGRQLVKRVIIVLVLEMVINIYVQMALLLQLVQIVLTIARALLLVTAVIIP
jgi:hypothetical protein